MLTPHQSAKAYHRASHTVAKTRQVVMLYDGMIRFLKQAREDMEKRNIEGRYHKLIRAGEIIMGLQSSLDFDHGGEPAKVLYGFYSNIDMRIIALHRSNDTDACDEVIKDLKDMRDVWDKIDRGDSKEESVVEKNVSAPELQDSISASA